jgi:hypothetical protein
MHRTKITNKISMSKNPREIEKKRESLPVDAQATIPFCVDSRSSGPTYFGGLVYVKYYINQHLVHGDRQIQLVTWRNQKDPSGLSSLPERRIDTHNYIIDNSETLSTIIA